MIRMRASYTDTWYDEPGSDPVALYGYTDPTNPFGGFSYENPGLTGEAFVRWQADNAELVRFDTIEEAAEFVADFPGETDGYGNEGYVEPSEMADGRDRLVTLHVLDQAEDVFRAARTIEAARDAKLAAYLAAPMIPNVSLRTATRRTICSGTPQRD